MTLPTTSTTLLTYAMATAPDPLQVTPSPTSPSVATLTFVASVPRSVGKCSVSQISIDLSIGNQPDATKLGSQKPPVSAATLTASDGAVWGIAEVGDGVFVFTPPNPPVQLANESLTIVFAGIEISPMVGTATVTVREWSAPGDFSPPDPKHRQPSNGQATFPTSKFPYGFHVSDFVPSQTQIESGGSVTLTWVGSDNADYSISYANQPAKTVDGRSWPSPPLYATTVFMLHATATVAGHTVERKLTTPVIVASPQVVEFNCAPDEIDYQQEVTLTWRATDADGVYLHSGQTAREKLDPVSDPNHPKPLQPQYGVDYTMQAYKTEPNGTVVVSPSVPLSFSFKEMSIVSFKADPTTVDLAHPSTTVSWEVLHAKAVAYQGATVAAKDSRPESPQADTTYQLTITKVDGTQVQAPPVQVKVVKVHVDGYSATFAQQGGNAVEVDLTLVVGNATAVTISGVVLVFSTTRHWIGYGQQYRSDLPGAVSMTAIDPTHWQAKLQFAGIPGNAMGYANVAMWFSYRADGFLPQSAKDCTVTWRGQFIAPRS